MSRHLAAFVVFICLLTQSASAGSGTIHRSMRPVKDWYIVYLDRSVGDADEAAQSLAQRFAGRVQHVYRDDPKGFSIKLTEAQALKLSADSRVALVYEDSTVPPPPNVEPTAQSGMGWALDRMDQHLLPLDGFYTYNYTGNGVTIYIVDTGVNAVSDLAGRIVRGINLSPADANYNPGNPLDYADC